jgi:hypothetical protein
LGNSNLGKENDQQGEELVPMDVNILLTMPAEFSAPIEDVWSWHWVRNMPCSRSQKIQGHLDGTSIGHMLVDGGASITILLLSLFKKLKHIKGDLKRTNLSLSSLAGDLTEVKGIICKEVTVGSRTMPTTFFVVDVKGHYNVLLRQDWIHSNECALLRQDWIHANECVPSTLHQCVIQWIGDEVEVVQADEEVCVAVVESQVDILGGKMECLSGKDLMGYDYISIGKDGFVPISVKLTIGATWLAHSL